MGMHGQNAEKKKGNEIRERQNSRIREENKPSIKIEHTYDKFMEIIDQSINHNWENNGFLLGENTDIDLNKEQQILLNSKLRSRIPTDPRINRPWDKRNLVSARNAWAMIRLPEQIRAMKVDQSLAPVVDAISLSKRDLSNVKSSWFNEEIAEQDKSLALLSEATQIYTKQILDKALQCTR